MSDTDCNQFELFMCISSGDNVMIAVNWMSCYAQYEHHDTWGLGVNERLSVDVQDGINGMYISRDDTIVSISG